MNPDKTEHVFPQLILHEMGVGIAESDVRRLRAKLDEHLGADLSFDSLGPGKSWNIPQMRMAARAISPGGGQYLDWWAEYFQFQLGLVPTEHPLLGFFDGNESFSPTYTPWRWGAVAAVLFAAGRVGRQDVVALCRAWLQAAEWMAFEMSVAYPDMVRQKGKKGQLFDNAWHVSPVGERGAAGHEITDIRLLREKWTVGLHRSDFFTKRKDWPYLALEAAMAQLRPRVVPTPSETGSLPNKLRWWSEQHVVKFPSGRLVYKTTRKNWNTPCYFFDWFEYAKKTAVLGFPWKEGRQFGAKGAGKCSIEKVGASSYVSCSTDYGETECRLPDEPILSHVIFGPEGFQRLV